MSELVTVRLTAGTTGPLSLRFHLDLSLHLHTSHRIKKKMSITINKEKEDKKKGTKEVTEYHKCTGLNKTATIKDLKEKLASEKRKNKHSIAFYYYEGGNTKDKKYYGDDVSLSGITSVYFKDLGPQIGYRTVFILEYLGPLGTFYLLDYLLIIDLLTFFTHLLITSICIIVLCHKNGSSRCGE